MSEFTPQSSNAWLFYVKACFFISLAAMAGGIAFIPADFLVKGYLAISALFLVSATITLSKTLRDEHERQNILHRISEARTQQLIKEYGE